MTQMYRRSCCVKFQNKVWLDYRLGYNNYSKFTDIKEVSNSLNHVDSVPGMYAFTWIDQVPAFHEKGKIILIKDLTLHKNIY